ncbi:MAG: alpha/beta hydrolase fold domain-containing protein [Planctomycetota bacterium]|nr:alpha/beta hydrolase fold domain-containing protein [Planctomycetota bacterium]
MLRLSFALVLMSAPLSAQDSLAVRLERIVDLPTASKRKKAALELARDKEITLDALLREMRRFGRFEEVAPGLSVATVALPRKSGNVEAELVLYVPSSYRPDTPSGLLVAFHGTGGSGRGMLGGWRHVAEESGLLLLAPSEAGPNEGYTFSPRERGDAMAAIRWMRRRFNVDENRVYLTGSSRGGHLAWDLALRFRDRFAAVAPMIGSPRLNIANGQNNLRYLDNVLDLPIRDLQGSKDHPYLIENLRWTFARLEKRKAADAKLIEFPELGHSYRLDAVDWNEFFANKRMPLFPRVVRACVLKTESRAFWADVLSTKRPVAETFKMQMDQKAYNKLDNSGLKRFMQGEADKRTARLEVERTPDGGFRAKTAHVRKFRVLLVEGWLPAKAVVCSVNGKTSKRGARRSKAVLAVEFAERFDRAFLPVAELRLP